MRLLHVTTFLFAFILLGPVSVDLLFSRKYCLINLSAKQNWVDNQLEAIYIT